jgi:glyoxylase-like metal-dependent hydrolase (beta-lactamase superfamily II)
VNKNWIKRGLIAGCALLALAGLNLAQQAVAQQNANAPDIEVLHVRGNIYILAGAGANITLSVGPDGVFMVDSGRAEMTDKVLAAVNRVSQQLVRFGQPATRNEGGGGSGTILTGYTKPKPIRYIANTSMLPDHAGGNEKLSAAGVTFTGGNVAGDLATAGEGAAIVAHENVLQRLSDAKVPFKALPTETYFGKQMKLSNYFNGEGIRLQHFAGATDGDSIVYFRTSDVISAGEIFSPENYPLIDLQRGGSVQGLLDGLNYMLDLIVPEFRSEGGTFVIPAHGRVGDDADVAYYRDMVTIIRDRVQAMMKKGMTLEQVKAARPTEDWDGRLGKTTGPWTTDMFVEAVYKSLAAKK